jgi:predicted ATPase
VRLDGLPLAIELATARLGLLSPRGLVDRLGNRLRLLQGGARDAPARQQTLRDTIAWSYDMLHPCEQRLFELLSVFSGATLEAVEQVMSRVADLVDVDVLDVLGSLVDKSLIARVDRGGLEPRFAMLETIREFATSRLDQDPARGAAARRAHAAHFAAWTQRQWEQLAGDGREAAAAQMGGEIENIRTAWRFWVAEKNLQQVGKLVDSLWLFHDSQGWRHATVQLTTDLLDLVSSTPATPGRVLEQITLQMSLARLLLSLEGYTQNVEDAYTRALDLCEAEGGIPDALPVLRALGSLHIYRAEFDKGAHIGEQILTLAERYDDPDARAEGHLLRGASLVMLNQLQSGVQHLEHGIAAYQPEQHRTGRFRLGQDPAVACFTTCALALWMLGFPGRARTRAYEAINLATQLNHPSSLAYAHFHTGLLHLWARQDRLASDRAHALIAIADEHEFRIWRAAGSCLLGAAMAGLGAADDGLAMIQPAMTKLQEYKGPPVFWPLLLQLQASAYGLAGRAAEGLAPLDEAVALATQGRGQTMWPELFRLKGELLLAVSADNAAEAEAWLRRAVETADQVHAPMLQLRAALSLAGLWRNQGNVEPARIILTDAYQRLTEGSATADLTDAHALLQELADSPPAQSGIQGHNVA